MNASKGKIIKTTHLDVNKEDYTKFRLVDSIKEFKLSLKGGIFIDNSILRPLHLYSPNERLSHSLTDSLVDKAKIRRLSLSNSKGASKDWNKDIIEPRTISNILNDSEYYNYSLRTGQVFEDKNLHLVILDIDRKKTYEQLDSLIQRILSQFHKYFTITTVSKGYHIYFLISSPNKIKSQTLKNGTKLSIEILAENKKVMGPGSVIDETMYRRLNPSLDFENSKSSEPLYLDELAYILDILDIQLDTTPYNARKFNVNSSVSLSSLNKSNIRQTFTDSLTNFNSIKFISPIHGSSQSTANTLLGPDGVVYCFRCNVSVSAREYLHYVEHFNLNQTTVCSDILSPHTKEFSSESNETNRGILKDNMDENIKQGKHILLSGAPGSGTRYFTKYS